MSSSRKKTAFYGLLITAGGVLAVCVIIFKDPFVEHLLLSRLESGSRIDKLEAAFSLVDRRSERAIPLIEDSRKRHSANTWTCWARRDRIPTGTSRSSSRTS